MNEQKIPERCRGCPAWAGTMLFLAVTAVFSVAARQIQSCEKFGGTQPEPATQAEAERQRAERNADQAES